MDDREEVMSEPLLRGNEIQGDSLAGFRKDHVRLLFLWFDPERIVEVKKWLLGLVPRLATLNAVAQFNDAFRMMRRGLRALDPEALKPPDPELYALWINIAFTAPGLTKLVGAAAVASFETAFLLGAHVRTGDVGDPTGSEPGAPETWVIGGPDRIPDAMINIAADYEPDLGIEVARLRAEIDSLGGAIRIIHEDIGDATIAPVRGHEHFGFRDGISQPGVRGILDTPTRPFLTPRLIDPSDPLGQTFASPGVPLIAPGEFVLGYERQDPDDALSTQDESLTRTEPEWARDGSYLVYRRLEQNVPLFEEFLDRGADELTRQGFTGIDHDRFGAMCVGRWKDGSPLARAPLAPDPALARDRYAPQSFFFWKDTVPVRWIDPLIPPDPFPPASMDGDGQQCPLSAHIRKVNPRDEATDIGHNVRTLRRRIVRRGISYGPSYDREPAAERGLLFLCYQGSIADQFEFLWRVWANKVNTPRGDAGFDPVIGQNGTRARESHFVQGERQAAVKVWERFIISTGGAYLFAPSISAIRLTLCA
jgi:Dyp-type peroxidase family